MSKVTLINITNVNDGKTPNISFDDMKDELVIGEETWRVVSADKFNKLDEAYRKTVQKLDLTDEAYEQLKNLVNDNNHTINEKLSAEINDVYASLKGRSQNYSYNSAIEPQGLSNAKPIDELLKLAGERPSSDYHDVYRIWKGQITKSNPWKKVIEKHQGDIFNDMKTGNYYRFVYDEEKGTAFWLQGSNTAVSDLISRLTIDGELITATKLNQILASSNEFQQFKVVDNSKKKEIERRLTELANEGQKMGTLVAGHNDKLNKINEFIKKPSIFKEGTGQLYIEDWISLAEQKAKDANNSINEYKKVQNETNSKLIADIEGAKLSISEDLKNAKLSLSEDVKGAKIAMSKDIIEVRKSLSAITSDVKVIGSMRNGKVIDGVGGKIRLECRVFRGAEDVTQIAHDNNCISWQLQGIDSASYGKFFDVDRTTVMSNSNEKASVENLVNTDKLIAILSSGYNLYLERNFNYQGYKFVPFNGGKFCYVKAHLYKDGIDITSQCSPLKIIAKGAGGYTKSNNDTVTFNAEDWRDGTPLFVELYDTTLGGAPLKVTEKITNGKDSEVYVRANLINQPNWDRTSNGNVHVTTDANKIIHWRGLKESTAWYNLPIYYNVSSDKKYILKWNYKIISGEFEQKYIFVGDNKFYLKNADKKDGECYAIIQGCEDTYISIYFSNIKAYEAEFWNFKLEEIQDGEEELPTPYVENVEDIKARLS